jgi:putative restriction endonuclease
MRYHWVSQNQTGQHEIPGGYMWCPKTNRNGTKNASYEMMRAVEPGDVVFSFRDKSITHVGVVTSEAYEAQKPTTFGTAGAGWLELGWMVNVEYEAVPRSFIPSMHMNVIGPLRPKKHSPLQATGRGNQKYFATLPDTLGDALLALAEMTPSMLSALIAMLQPLIDRERIERLSIPATEKLALIAARVGQGAFRTAVQQIEPCCRITGVSDPTFLRASHIKPWRVANDHERLDGYNGLMLTPTIDQLFDQGYISFKQSGELLLVPSVSDDVWSALSVPVNRPHYVGQFLPGPPSTPPPPRRPPSRGV